MEPPYDATDWRRFFAVRTQQLGLRRKAVAREVGKSQSWLSQVLSGRQLDPEVVPALIAVLRLDEEGAEYFEALVDLENGSARARRAASGLVAAKQRQRAARGLAREEALAFSRWYVAAVLELARCDGFRPDASWIARTLSPPITVAQAADAMGRLIGLGMLVPDESGRWQAHELWSASELPVGEVSRAASRTHRQTIGFALGALAAVRENERHVTGTTAAISEEHYAVVVARLRDLERQIVACAIDDPGPRNRVYHLGIQWFPLSDYTDVEDHSMADNSQGPPPDMDPDTTE